MDKKDDFRDLVAYVACVDDFKGLDDAAHRLGGVWFGGGTKDRQTGSHYMFRRKVDRDAFLDSLAAHPSEDVL